MLDPPKMSDSSGISLDDSIDSTNELLELPKIHMDVMHAIPANLNDITESEDHTSPSVAESSFNSQESDLSDRQAESSLFESNDVQEDHEESIEGDRSYDDSAFLYSHFLHLCRLHLKIREFSKKLDELEEEIRGRDYCNANPEAVDLIDLKEKLDSLREEVPHQLEQIHEICNMIQVLWARNIYADEDSLEDIE